MPHPRHLNLVARGQKLGLAFPRAGHIAKADGPAQGMAVVAACHRPDDAAIKDASYAITSVYGFGHPLYYDNVISTLRGEKNAEVDGYEGLRSLEVIIAAYRSARDGTRVGLPLVF